MTMATQQLLVRLPEELARRLKRRVPARDLLYQAALEVERDERLAAEMAEWDVTLEDRLTLAVFKPS